MNKTELIAEVAAKCAISKKDAEKTVNATHTACSLLLHRRLQRSSTVRPFA